MVGRGGGGGGGARGQGGAVNHTWKSVIHIAQTKKGEGRGKDNGVFLQNPTFIHSTATEQAKLQLSVSLFASRRAMANDGSDDGIFLHPLIKTHVGPETGASSGGPRHWPGAAGTTRCRFLASCNTTRTDGHAEFRLLTPEFLPGSLDTGTHSRRRVAALPGGGCGPGITASSVCDGLCICRYKDYARIVQVVH